jgi:hypothetical protein
MIGAKSPFWVIARRGIAAVNAAFTTTTERRSMLRKLIFFGAVAGLVAGVPLSTAIAMIGPAASGMVVGYLIMLIGLSAVFVAIKQYRDVELGGVMRFWPGFGLGLGISAVAGVFYVLAWETVSAFSHMDFATDYTKALIEQQKAAGVAGDALVKFIADMERFKAQYANPLYRLPMVFAEIFPVGVLVSAVSAGLLRNSRFLPLRRN